MNKLKRFFTTSGIYLVGNVMTKLISLFMLPLYTSKLLPDKFGIYDVAITTISLTVPIIFFQIWDGMFRYSFEKKELNDKYIIITNSFFLWIIGLILYSAFYFSISELFHFNFRLFIYLYGLTTAVQYQYAYIARAFLKNKLFVISGLLNSTLCALISVILILIFDIGIESLYIAPVIGSAAQAALIEAVLHPVRNIRLTSINTVELKRMLKFTIPLCLATIFYWLFSGYTKIAIMQKLGIYYNGLYAVAGRFTSLITFLLTVFQYAWNETAYLMAVDDNRFVKYEKSVGYVFKIIICGCSILILITKLLFPYIVNSSYNEALAIIPITFAGVAINAFSSFVDTIFMAEKQTRKMLLAIIIGAGINVAAFQIFTPMWKLMGAVGALTLSYAILALCRILTLYKVFSIRFKLSNIRYLFILTAAILIYYADKPIWQILAIVIISAVSLWCLREFVLPIWKNATKKIWYVGNVNMFGALFCRLKVMYLKLKYGKKIKFNSQRQVIRADTEITIGKNANVYIGSLNVNTNVHIECENGELKINSDVIFNRNCIISCRYKITIGNNCLFGPNVCIYDHDHFYGPDGLFHDKFNCSEIIIEDSCWIGANSVILRGTHIGKNSVIGAGVVVRGEVSANSLVIGVNDVRIIPTNCLTAKFKI